MKEKDTSWQEVGKWYDDIVGKKGHYYHQQVILPKAIKLLNLKKSSSLIDFGSGSSPICSYLPKEMNYCGVDSAKHLLTKAKSYHGKKGREFHFQDSTKPFDLKKRFTHAIFVLSLQNMEDSKAALENAYNHLEDKGHLLLIMNHPCFRIPRQSSWDKDLSKKMLSRKISLYLSSLKIPIHSHPSKEKAHVTYSFHKSLSTYSKELFELGFVTLLMEEWTSDKMSTGKYAQMENRARKEFPLFLALLARKG